MVRRIVTVIMSGLDWSAVVVEARAESAASAAFPAEEAPQEVPAPEPEGAPPAPGGVPLPAGRAPAAQREVPEPNAWTCWSHGGTRP